MRLVVCAVRDRAIVSFGTPFFVASTAQAVRSFSDAVNSRSGDKTDIASHPEDFDLWELGLYDPDTGFFSQDGGPRQVAVGKDLLNSFGTK